MRTIGWMTIGMAVLLLVAGLVIGAGGPIDPPSGAPHAAITIARIAPWPVLAPLAVVLLAVARRAVTGSRAARAIAIGTCAAFLGFGLLGGPWGNPGASGGLVLIGKLAWLAANGYVVVTLLSTRDEHASHDTTT